MLLRRRANTGQLQLIVTDLQAYRPLGPAPPQPIHHGRDQPRHRFQRGRHRHDQSAHGRGVHGAGAGRSFAGGAGNDRLDIEREDLFSESAREFLEVFRVGALLRNSHVDFGDHETSPNHVGTIICFSLPHGQDQARLPNGDVPAPK